MIERILKKGKCNIHISYTHSFTNNLLGEMFMLLDDMEKNTITISVNLKNNYKNSKDSNTYLDIEALDEDWKDLTLFEVSDNQICENFLRYSTNRKVPKQYFLKVIGKNEAVRQVEVEHKDLNTSLTLRVID